MPTERFTNVFHFSTYPSLPRTDRIPVLFIKNDGHFQICFYYGEGNQCNEFPFDIGTWYQMFIKQYKSCGKYWYEIIIDGAVKFRTQNNFPVTTGEMGFRNMKLYASDPWTNPFTSDIGSICNVNLGGTYVTTYVRVHFT